MPLNRSFTADRQGGPPQFDFNVAMPIDWFLFGKRAAAITSGQYGVEASAADFANTVRLRIAATIAAFYDVLEMQAMLQLAYENQSNLIRMEQIILKRVALGESAPSKRIESNSLFSAATAKFMHGNWI